MAYHHHHHHHHQNNHQTTASATSCCCQPPPPPPQPPVSTDPFVVAALVSQLFQTPNQNPQTPLDFYSHPIHPPNVNPKQRYPHLATHPFHQFQHPPSLFPSLLQRIDALEASLHRFTSSSCFSLRDAAARTIQTHFRVYVVRRSRTLRQLKELASFKSSLASLNSSFSRRGFVDFDSLSHRATDLLLLLDSIQSGDQLVRDSKRSITREIIQFLEMVDGVCEKRHQILTKTMTNMRLIRDEYSATNGGRGSSERGVESGNMGSNERKLIANLRKRVERIGRMSRSLEREEVDHAETDGFEHVDDDENSEIMGQITNNYKAQNGASLKKNSLLSNAKKRVCFVEDGNVVRVYNTDEDIRRNSRYINVIEDSSKRRQDEEDPQSDVEGSLHSSEDGNNCVNDKDSGSHFSQDGGFTFSVPESVKTDALADLMMRKPGVKIVGQDIS